jgi:hypothetical protein
LQLNRPMKIAIFLLFGLFAHAGPYTELRIACENDSRLNPIKNEELVKQLLCENVRNAEEANLVIACFFDTRIHSVSYVNTALLCENIKTLENLDAVISCYQNQTFRGDDKSVAICSRVQSRDEIPELVACYRRYHVLSVLEAYRCR